MSEHINDRLTHLERKVHNMSKELDDLKASVELLNKAVGEAVGEIKSLADQLSAAANKPNPEAAEIESIAANLKDSANKLHVAVYPPSSNVPL